MGNDCTKISNFNIEIKDLSGAKFSKKVTINGHTFRLMSKKSLSLINQVDVAFKKASSLIKDAPEQFLKHDFSGAFKPILKKGFFEKIFGIAPKYKQELRTQANEIIQQQRLIKYQKLEEEAYKGIKGGKYTNDLKAFLNSNEMHIKLKAYKESFHEILGSKSDSYSKEEIDKLLNLKTELSDSILSELGVLENKKEKSKYGADDMLPVMLLITLPAIGTNLSYNFLPQSIEKLENLLKNIQNEEDDSPVGSNDSHHRMQCIRFLSDLSNYLKHILNIDNKAP